MSNIGKKVKVKKNHAAAPKGMSGKITEEHKMVGGGSFYGIAVGTGTAYVPATNVDPDNDGDNDTLDSDDDADAVAGGEGGSIDLSPLNVQVLNRLLETLQATPES